MSEAVIELRGVTKDYGRTRALAGLDLNVRRGELFGLVGVNGAGKTTTMNVIMGFIRASSGTARVLGGDPWADAAELHRRIAWLPGDVRLFENLSGRDWLEYQAAVAGLDRSRIAPLAREWDVPIERPTRTLSKGNRQKVALLRLLMSDAELLVLDEPTSGLDPFGQDRLLAALRDRAADGRTVLFSSHSLAEVQTLCDRVAVIDAGRVVNAGTIGELTGGTRVLEVWTRDPIDATVVARFHGRAVTATRAAFNGDRLLEDVLPALAPFGVERAEYGGISLETLLENVHSPARARAAQEVVRS